jgi:hypothetical protein
MLKKVFRVLGALVAILVVLVVLAGLIFYFTVDKAFIESRISSALNRHVTIEKIDTSVFSIVSGIELNNLAVSNFKTPEKLAALTGKPVDQRDLFVGMEALLFKLKFLPLFKRRVEVKELLLIRPVIHLSKNKQGVLNIDDLIKSKQQPVGKENKGEGSKDAAKPARPLGAGDLPVAVAVGEVGMKNATVNYYDAQQDQRFQVYKLTALLHDIRIDPKELEKNDEIKLKVGMGVKTVESLKTGSVQSFDVTLDAAGKVIPFDLQTRLLNPEILVHVAVPDGEITGLQIFNAVTQVPLLGDYLGDHISFLKDTLKWNAAKESGMDLRYKDQQADIKNGRLDLAEAKVLFDGGTNLASKAVGMNIGLVMRKETGNAVISSLTEKIDSLIKSPHVKKYVDSASVAQTAMKPLLNSEGSIDFAVVVGGTTSKPVVTLSRPQLGSLSAVVTEAAAGVAVEAGQQAVKAAAKKYLNTDQQQLLDDVGGLLKKK